MAEKLGALKMRPCIARAFFDFEDNTLPPVSLFSWLTCFFCGWPFQWLWIFSSTTFSLVLGPRRSAYTLSCVWCSSSVSKFAKSLLCTLTPNFPGSLMVNVIGLSFMLLDSVASFSYEPSRFIFDFLFSWVLLAIFSCTSLCSFRPRCRFDSDLPIFHQARWPHEELCLHLNEIFYYSRLRG